MKLEAGGDPSRAGVCAEEEEEEEERMHCGGGRGEGSWWVRFARPIVRWRGRRAHIGTHIREGKRRIVASFCFLSCSDLWSKHVE